MENKNDTIDENTKEEGVQVSMDYHADGKTVGWTDHTLQEKPSAEEPVSKLDKIDYGVLDVPPVYMCILLGFQHYISMFLGSLSVPFVLGPAMCLGGDGVAMSEIIGTLGFVSGLVTLAQIFVGIRLPIVQAGTFALLVPTLSYLNLPQFACPPMVPAGTNITEVVDNLTVIVGSPEHRDVWTSRMREIQGSIMVASLLEVLLGASGAIGGLLKFIGPLSICPTVTLLGISLFRSAANYASKQWWIAIMTLLLNLIFSQYLGIIDLPCWIRKKGRGCVRRKEGYPFFRMFPIILSVCLSWLVCYILTLTNTLPNDPDKWGYFARTDFKSSALSDAPWFRFPYPGQWGLPRVSAALVCGLFAGLLASIIESVGDYHACARLSGAPAVPTHAINRGILIEGVGSILAGAWGTGNGTTSTSINVGVVGITKSGSRVVVLYCVGFQILMGLIVKFGALFTTVPDPIIGGMFFILFGMITAVGISSLRDVNMNSSRNLFVLGFSLFLGLTLSEWLKDNPNAINTGSQIADNILTVLGSTGMFVGGVVGLILDNTIRGNRRDRGLEGDDIAKDDASDEVKELTAKVYNLPCKCSCLNAKCTRYLPFCQNFRKRDEDVEMINSNGKIFPSTEKIPTISKAV